MTDQLGLFDEPKDEVMVFGAEGHLHIHNGITHCHKCYPEAQATRITRNEEAGGYDFECIKCKSKWGQTDRYIKEYLEADQEQKERFGF